jgi:ABC-type branched-subunit amino acid transport system ATPase component
MSSSDTVLQTCDLRMAFGGLKIFDRLNFSLRRGERHAVIGPNGAGKSTFVNLVTGLLKPTAGRLLLEGRDAKALEKWSQKISETIKKQIGA